MSNSNRFVRAKTKAKDRAIRVDTAAFTNAVALTTVATAGTFSTVATSNLALKLSVNGTDYKIPLFTA